MKRYMHIFTVFFFLFFFFYTDVHAYIDSGSISYALQILIAGFVGVVFVVKVFWKNIKQFFARLFKKKNEK